MEQRNLNEYDFNVQEINKRSFEKITAVNNLHLSDLEGLLSRNELFQAKSFKMLKLKIWCFEKS